MYPATVLYLIRSDKEDSSGTDINHRNVERKTCFTLLLDDFIEILKKVLIFLGFHLRSRKTHRTAPMLSCPVCFFFQKVIDIFSARHNPVRSAEVYHKSAQ